MKELIYQKKYTDELMKTSTEYLLGDTSKLIIFQAPTGAGKTLMLSNLISTLVKKLELQKELSFVWISVNYLHEQSKDKLEGYFKNERLLECININDIENNCLDRNQILFVNWESLNKEGISLFMSDNEKDWNLNKVAENTKDSGRDIVLIIDESHRAASTSKAKEIVDVIGPKLTIEVSATPKEGITNDHKVTVPLKDVIEEGMIKEEILINPGISSISSNEDIVKAALKKRQDLRKAYENLGKSINPLLLIQIPRKKATDNVNPEDRIIEILSKVNINLKNGKLAIWLADKDKKINLDAIEAYDSNVEVLIFKEAIAQGWDCPRAAILLLQREWNIDNYTFNIQTLGRIMRMPEQTHYLDEKSLNVGYVFTASDNFNIVAELAENYVSKVQMLRDNTIYKNIKLRSEFIRRKREKQRLSGEFRDCLLKTAEEGLFQDKINLGKVTFKKSIGIEGQVESLDKTQKIEFKKSTEIVRDREEVLAMYNDFVRSLTSGFSQERSTEIIKSSIRSLFKKFYGISNEDEINNIVLNPNNRSDFEQLIHKAKLVYSTLPEREDTIIPTEEWEVPEVISIFDNYSNISWVKKSILKPYFIKKDKNGREMWSRPERLFVEELEKTDNDTLWWYKNGETESKFLGIAYRKEDNNLYGFYPDYILKTKQEVLIIEIKDNNDFKSENILKLNAGKEYIKNYGNVNIKFYILSPIDYFNFFKALKEANLNGFSSSFEGNLLKYSQSIKVTNGFNKEEDVELLKIYDKELSKAIDTLEDTSLENELLKIDLEEAKKIIKELQISLQYNASSDKDSPQIDLKSKLQLPFNLCILGETGNQDEVFKELNKYFLKFEINSTEWDIEFFNNAKLKNTNVLAKLKKGQSRYNLIVTGQIFHHSNEGNSKANLLTELNNNKYVDHIVGSSPKDLLTSSGLITALDTYFSSL